MNNNKLKFEFDFNDVFKGIQAGVIRELAEYDFNAVADSVITDLKHGLRREIQLSYSNMSELKNEIKNEIKEKVFKELICETRERYLTQFEDYIEEQLLKNPDRLSCLSNEIKHDAVEELYKDLYSDVRREIQGKLNDVLNAISGTGVKVTGSNLTLSQEEYEELLESDKMLSALERAGVDNWEGYDFAIELMNDDTE
jgi:hypothetical protein